MEVIAREMIPLPGGDGLLVVARQTENGVAMRKWALLTRTEDMTAIVVATIARDGARGLSGRGAARRVRQRHGAREALAGRDARRAALPARRSRRLPPAAREPGRHRGAHIRAERHDAARPSSPTSWWRRAPSSRRSRPSATASRSAS